MGSTQWPTQLTGDGHSLDAVYNATPTAQGQDPHAVFLKVPQFGFRPHAFMPGLYFVFMWTQSRQMP